MFFDIIDAILLVSKSFRRVFPAKFADYGDSCLGHVTREFNLFDTPQNYVVDFHWVAGSERGPKRREFKEIWLLSFFFLNLRSHEELAHQNA